MVLEAIGNKDRLGVLIIFHWLRRGSIQKDALLRKSQEICTTIYQLNIQTTSL